ncbi:transposase [Roseomonas sp. HJA6]|uniref:Transposase n=1 Tax=Roseomonas alba TaxID=2846776 RepID=A0ABS7AIY7_9PROT|nr:transposase [Neoroseomonas alba]
MSWPGVTWRPRRRDARRSSPTALRPARRRPSKRRRRWWPHARGTGDPCGAEAVLVGRDRRAGGPVPRARDARAYSLGQRPALIAEAVKAWIAGVGVRTAYSEKASPWENGCVESFNGELSDEPLNHGVFNTLRVAQLHIEEWRRHYNRVRPHSSLGCRPPVPETVPMVRSPISSEAGAAAVAH